MKRTAEHAAWERLETMQTQGATFLKALRESRSAGPTTGEYVFQTGVQISLGLQAVALAILSLKEER